MNEAVVAVERKEFESFFIRLTGRPRSLWQQAVVRDTKEDMWEKWLARIEQDHQEYRDRNVKTCYSN